MSLHILAPGWATRIVDLGRPGTRSLGVPLGGAADRTSLMLGNALVGNPSHFAGLEICVKGPTLRADCDLACVVFGAPFDLAGPRQSLRTGVTFTLHEGEDLHIGGTPRGMAAYFCVQGGLQTPEILGSKSSLSILPTGSVIPCRPGKIGRRFLPTGLFETWNDSAPLRILPGLQSSWFDMAEFLGQEYTVAPASDRMGIRLEAKPLTHTGKEMTSEPVCPGSVQVTRDGQCIILSVDGQTIGGYPKIAQVIAADLDRVGQIRPRQTLRFSLVDQAKALALWEERRELLAEWLMRARFSLADGGHSIM